MPTPVSTARQCLTDKAAAALDEAVAVARRRGHAQTTSLHMVSSLLSIPNSSLREACSRIRNNAYSTRVQFKALELSLSVSLDRMPSSQSGSKLEEPPVSNSLMAAIKRSQANQRRQPENFNFYQQQQQYSSSVPVVKVELQNLILSILDDPLVSRVFGEAGFRSCDVKFATLRPGNSFHPPHLFGYTSRYKRPIPPLFLCNFSTSNSNSDSVSDMGSKGFSFPFMGCYSMDENSTRIGEIMLRTKKRNPLLLGVSSNDALSSFLETVEKKIEGVLPVGLTGISVVCVKDDVLRFVNGGFDEGLLELRFKEVEKLLENVRENGVLVNIGDMNAFVGDGVVIHSLRYLVGRLTKLLEVHGRKLWLIGAAVTHDVYVKFLNKFPSIEEDWDMEIVPITSLKFPVGGSYPRSSLMESFVPLGGFFSMPSDTKSTLSNAGQFLRRCNICNEKYEKEATALSNGGLCASITEQCQSSLPSWLENAETIIQSGSATIKAKDDSLLLNAKIIGLQQKWDSICRQHHHSQPLRQGYGHQYPRVLGFQVAEDNKNEYASDVSKNYSNVSSTEQVKKSLISSLSTDLQQGGSVKGHSSLNLNQLSMLSKHGEVPSECSGREGRLKNHHLDSSSSSIGENRTSPKSVTSVTTDLGLGTISSSICKDQDKPADQSRVDLIPELSGSSTNVDTFSRRISNCRKSSSCYVPDVYRHFEVKDPKLLYRGLVEKVSRQEHAISAVVEAISQHGTETMSRRGLNRSDKWIHLQGPDTLGKKKLAAALAEILYGSTESLIYVDLSFQDQVIPTDKLVHQDVTNKYDSRMRGTVVDYLVEKLSKKPCVIVLENINKADMVVQNSLFHALKTGRFADSHGREVSTSNSIFLATTNFIKCGQPLSESEDSAKYSEEDILRTKCYLIQLLIRFDLNDDLMSHELRHLDAEKKGCYGSGLMNKRKITSESKNTDRCSGLEVRKKAKKSSNSYLDLNVPAEGSDISDSCTEESESGSSSDNSKSWLENFDEQIDRAVVFEPFDFATLAEKVSKEMSECLHEIVGSKCVLEIDPKVMQQVLAAAYLSDKKTVGDWIRRVLRQGFLQAVENFSLDAHSIVKLVTCDTTVPTEQLENLLPARIIVN